MAKKRVAKQSKAAVEAARRQQAESRGFLDGIARDILAEERLIEEGRAEQLREKRKKSK